MATLLLALAVISTGLYAGFLLIFRTGIMPALGRLTDEQFVAVMRGINVSVPRPVFLLVFLAVLVFPATVLAVPADGRSDGHFWLVLAGLTCSVIGHLVTVGGNVPLNTSLAAPGSLTDAELRAAFESRWNGFHLVRTLLAVAGFVLVVCAAVV